MDFFLQRYKKFGHVIDPKKIKISTCIRINTLKADVSVVVKRLKSKKVKLEKVPFLHCAYWAESSFPLSSTQEYLLGMFYIQEAASQLPVVVLSPKGDELVLDMCAAPGSKTTQLAQAMDNMGKIVALDKNTARLEALNNNIERCAVKNVLVYQKDALHAGDIGLKFDKILLDAPCSGNFAIDKDWFEKRTIDEIRTMARTQKALLKVAALLLKKGGTLVYSTCSLEPEEDEEVVEHALDTLDLVLEDTGILVGEPGLTQKTSLCRRFWPEKTNTQGFFIAKFKVV